MFLEIYLDLYVYNNDCMLRDSDFRILTITNLGYKHKCFQSIKYISIVIISFI